MMVTLSYPSRKKEFLQIEVEGRSDEFIVIQASALTPALNKWTDCTAEIAASDYYKDFIAGELTEIETSDDRSDEYYERNKDETFTNDLFSMSSTMMKAGGM